MENRTEPKGSQNLTLSDPRLVADLNDPVFSDSNGKPMSYTVKQIERMIEILEESGRYDVVGRRW